MQIIRSADKYSKLFIKPLSYIHMGHISMSLLDQIRKNRALFQYKKYSIWIIITTNVHAKLKQEQSVTA